MTPTQDIYYVYQHRKATTGEIFYVGKGSGSRAHHVRSRNPYWDHITHRHGFRVEILVDNLYEEVAFALEKHLIAQYREEGLRLANLTDGGDGAAGNAWPVVCLDTGTVFRSAACAAQWVSSQRGRPARPTYINDAARGSYARAYGYQWKYQTVENFHDHELAQPLLNHFHPV